VRVRLETSEGAITLALDTRRAPKTSANFLAYVDDGRFDGTSFYRAARSKKAAELGYVQAARAPMCAATCRRSRMSRPA